MQPDAVSAGMRRRTAAGHILLGQQVDEDRDRAEEIIGSKATLVRIICCGDGQIEGAAGLTCNQRRSPVSLICADSRDRSAHLSMMESPQGGHLTQLTLTSLTSSATDIS